MVGILVINLTVRVTLNPIKNYKVMAALIKNMIFVKETVFLTVSFMKKCWFWWMCCLKYVVFYRSSKIQLKVTQNCLLTIRLAGWTASNWCKTHNAIKQYLFLFFTNSEQWRLRSQFRLTELRGWVKTVLLKPLCNSGHILPIAGRPNPVRQAAEQANYQWRETRQGGQ